MKLRDWEVEGYRSIGQGQFEADEFNILIGRNNTGKSNIIKSLVEYAGYVTRRMDHHDLFHSEIFDDDDEILDLFDSPDWDKVTTRSEEHTFTQISFKFEFDDTEQRTILSALRSKDVDEEYIELCKEHNSFSQVEHILQYDGSGVNIRLKVNLPKEGMTIIQDTIDERLSLYYYQLGPESVNQSSSSDSVYTVLFRRIQKSLMRWRLSSAFRQPEHLMVGERAELLEPSGSNLVQILDTMADNYPRQFNRIEEAYVEIMDGVTGIRTPYVGDDNRRSVLIDEEGYEEGFTLDEISGGSQEILTLITAVVKAEKEADLLLIEEPELHIHPGAQQAIYDLIRDVCDDDGPQVILSTHSEEFVNRSDASNILRVKRDVFTDIKTVDQGEIDAELEDLGYNKSELLQSRAVVFVEGKSDELIIEQLGKTLGDFDEAGIEIVELDGEGNIKSDGRSLVKLLYAFDIPYLFVVDSHDEEPSDVRDEFLTDINARQGNWHTTPDHFHVWPAYGIETYLLESPEAIANHLSTDVETIQTLISDHSPTPDKAEILENIFQEVIGESYNKDRDGMFIARQMDEADIHEDVVEAIDKIRSLIGEPQ